MFTGSSNQGWRLEAGGWRISGGNTTKEMHSDITNMRDR